MLSDGIISDIRMNICPKTVTIPAGEQISAFSIYLGLHFFFMLRSNRPVFYKNKLFRTFLSLVIIAICSHCNGQSFKNSVGSVDTTEKVAPESLHFIAQVIEKQDDGSRGEFDTTTGYRKYYYPNGNLHMEGKVTKAGPDDYRDGIWKYYNEDGQLMKQETSTQKGKINELKVTYFTNGNPLSKTYQYFEGSPRNSATFELHKIETLFYTNGQKLSERHLINGKIENEKCWDSKGNPQSIEYLKTLKSVEAD